MQKIVSWLRRKASPQTWFLFLALSFGSVYALLTPAFLGGDELYHFVRAYQVADGGFVAAKTPQGTGGYVPVSIFAVHAYVDQNHTRPQHAKAAIFNFPLKPQEKLFASFPFMAVYNPLMYAPQALAIRTGMVFQLPPAAMLYMARLANLIFYAAILFLAIRLIPFGKIALMVVALLPMHIVSASSASADTFTLAISALFVAVILYCRARKTLLTKKGVALFMTLVAAMSLTKLPMPLFLLLAPLIPPRVLGGTRKKWFGLLAMAAGIALLVGGTWVAIIKATLSPYGPAGVDVVGQLQFLLQHPFSFLQATLVTYMSELSNAMVAGAAVSLTPPDTVFPLWLTVAYAAFVTFLFPIRAGRLALRAWERWLLAGLALSFVIGTAALLYLSWTPVGAGRIDGIQPRYLTPLLFFSIALFATKLSPAAGRLRGRWFYALPPVFLAYTLYIIVKGFYL